MKLGARFWTALLLVAVTSAGSPRLAASQSLRYDTSGLVLFWRTADILAGGSEPTEAEWRRLLGHPGYAQVERIFPFLPGIVSTRAIEDAVTFAPDGSSVAFARREGRWGSSRGQGALYLVQRSGSGWTEPELLPFSGEHDDAEPSFTPDGRHLLFTSTRPVDGRATGAHDVWIVERTADGWAEPRHLGPRLGSPVREYSPVMTADGSVYFASPRAGGLGQGDLYGRNRHTGIDDYLAAAEWLIEEGYTGPGRLVLNASSAGGAVGGAALVQRPELFGAAILDYPVLDLLRYDSFTGGRSWRSEFGTVEDPDDFAALLAHSPYHNVRLHRCYPPTLLSPGELDEVTPPLHAYKFAAALQHAQGCDEPILLRVTWGAGHSAGATVEDAVDTWTDQLSFLVRALRDRGWRPGGGR